METNEKNCHNCKYLSLTKVSCTNRKWRVCIVRDSDGQIFEYTEHQLK